MTLQVEVLAVAVGAITLLALPALTYCCCRTCVASRATQDNSPQPQDNHQTRGNDKDPDTVHPGANLSQVAPILPKPNRPAPPPPRLQRKQYVSHYHSVISMPSFPPPAPPLITHNMGHGQSSSPLTSPRTTHNKIRYTVNERQLGPAQAVSPQDRTHRNRRNNQHSKKYMNTTKSVDQGEGSRHQRISSTIKRRENIYKRKSFHKRGSIKHRSSKETTFSPQVSSSGDMQTSVGWRSATLLTAPDNQHYNYPGKLHLPRVVHDSDAHYSTREKNNQITWSALPDPPIEPQHEVAAFLHNAPFISRSPPLLLGSSSDTSQTPSPRPPHADGPLSHLLH